MTRWRTAVTMWSAGQVPTAAAVSIEESSHRDTP
jgi:hypothetical protein